QPPKGACRERLERAQGQQMLHHRGAEPHDRAAARERTADLQHHATKADPVRYLHRIHHHPGGVLLRVRGAGLPFVLWIVLLILYVTGVKRVQKRYRSEGLAPIWSVSSREASSMMVS